MFTGDAFPENFKTLMTFIGEEYAAEFSAHVDFDNGYKKSSYFMKEI